jgi:hypothetical protein
MDRGRHCAGVLAIIDTFMISHAGLSCSK